MPPSLSPTSSSPSPELPFPPLPHQATKSLIDTSFKKLRSAEAALELLQNFKSIKLEGAIDRQLFDKQNEILLQFGREIDNLLQIFERQKLDPPITRNQPIVAGAIRWSRSLFARIKKTMKRLQGSTLADVLTSDEVRSGKKRGGEFAKECLTVPYKECLTCLASFLSISTCILGSVVPR